MIALLSVMGGLCVLILAPALRLRDPSIDRRVAALGPGPTFGPRKRSYLARLGTRLPGDVEAFALKIERAGVDIDPQSFKAARAISALVGGLILAAIGGVFLILVPGGVALGWRLPSHILRSKAQARRQMFDRDLPDAVELLAICMRSGLNMQLALERVADGQSGPLGDELKRYTRDVTLGARRDEALVQLGHRVGSEQLGSLISVIQGSERFGTEIAARLEGFADAARDDRRREVEERARKAPVKILFPLVIFILPAFMLLTVVPLLLGTFRGLGF